MFNKEKLITSIFHTPWHLMRWVRLVVGIWAISNFVRAWNGAHTSTIDYIVLGAGIYFLYKALLNTGCEVVTNYKQTDKKENETTTIDYEEIK